MKQIKTKSGDIIILSISEQIPINRPDGITLGKLSELTNKDCEKFVVRYGLAKGDILDDNIIVEEDILFGWKNYINNKTVQPYEFESAKESFISLLQSEGVDTSKEYLIIKML